CVDTNNNPRPNLYKERKIVHNPYVCKKNRAASLKKAARISYLLTDSLLTIVLYFRYMLVDFPSAYTLFTNYVKHIQYAACHIFLFNLFLKEPLYKLKGHKVLQFDAFVGDIVKLLSHIHLLFEHF